MQQCIGFGRDWQIELSSDKVLPAKAGIHFILEPNKKEQMGPGSSLG